MMKSLTKDNSIAKGYRLRSRTHKLIARLSKKTRNNIDSVLWKACKEYSRKVSAS